MKAVRFSHTDVHTRSQHMCIDGDIKNVGAYKCVCLRATWHCCGNELLSRSAASHDSHIRP